jgi:type I restriction enzyme S subunit
MWASLADIDAYHICEGDLLVCEGGDVGRAGIFQCGNEEPLIIQNSLHRVRPKHNNLNEYLLRILQTVRYAGWFDVLCSKATIVHFTGDKFGSLAFSVAPHEEQKAIVNYLNGETARIDALVSKKTRFIELLREKRQALITQAVTRGLDPTVKMKDSGVEWLGEVPEYWDVISLKHDTTFITSGSRGWAEHYEDSGALFIRIGNLTRDSISLDLTDIQRVIAPDSVEGERTKVKDGDILFSITAYLGSVAIVPSDLELAYVSQHVALVRLIGKKLNSVWVGYIALSYIGKYYFNLQGYGGTKIQLSLNDIANMLITVPPFEEQSEIISYLDCETTRIDALISKTQHSINLLKERRAALITAAVTGQIDVRDGLPGNALP